MRRGRARKLPADGWQKRGFDDAEWKNAVLWKQASGPEEQPVLQPWIPDSVKVLWKPFDAGKPIQSARLYATALGTYELYLNDAPVRPESQPRMAPGWTDYRERVLYQTYDVTDLVKSGQNGCRRCWLRVGIRLSLEWLQQPNNYGDTPPALRAQLRIEYADGKVEWVGTDATGKRTRHSSSTRNCMTGKRRICVNCIERLAGRVMVQPKESPSRSFIRRRSGSRRRSFRRFGIDQALSVVKMTEPKPGVFHLRLRAEHGGSREACCIGSGRHRRAGAGGRGAESGWNAVHGEPENGEGDGSLHSFGTRDRCTGTAFHFSRIPLYRGHGSKERLRRAWCLCAGVAHGLQLYSEAEDRQRDGQQAVEQYSVGAAIEFCGAADRLSAAR